MGERIALEQRRQKGYPYEIVILPLLTRPECERLQISTELLLIITRTADKLSKSTDINDLKGS